MSLTPQTLDKLKEVLRRAMALVYINDKPTGSAFFVSDRLLLTCQHVVTDHETCEVEPFQRRRREAAVVFADPGTDFALLSVMPDSEEPMQPCVLLDTAASDGDCVVAGFPREESSAPGLELFQVIAHPRSRVGETPAIQSLRLEAGKVITWGMSGGPVLDANTGAVTGVIRSSNDPTDALGGGAVPISQILPLRTELERFVNEPPPAIRPWRDALGLESWRALGKEWELSARIDLRISGARKHWRISMDQIQGAAHDVTIRDLGEDVAEALFRWAQRRRIRRLEEVELLGRLLASALIPPSVAEHLRAVRGADVLVRLHIERGNDLADIPWELAAVPGQNDRFLAADEEFRLVRVMPGDHTHPEPRAAAESVTVLAVVAQPSQWTFPTVAGEYREKPYAWPDAPMICQGLREAIENQGFKLDLFECPQWNDVNTALDAGSADIFHYVGVGRMGNKGEPLISFVDEDGQTEWEDAREIVERAAENGAVLVVLELMLPPDAYDYEPVTPSSLGDMLSHNINAVVLTHLPVHPLQMKMFNQPFYQILKSGESVETAVQLGRRKLLRNKPVEDAAGFGWFTLVTGTQPGFAVVAKRPEDLMQVTVKQQQGSQPGMMKSGSWQPRSSGDEYGP